MNQTAAPSPSDRSLLSPQYLFHDVTSAIVVFLVALPLCLGIALASGAPLISGLLAGIIGGLVVGSISGSSTSVSGPAAGLTAIVSAQIVATGSFEAFLVAVFIAGILQIGLGLARAGELSAFFPTSVIKGLLAAIGVILILKQIPHLLGHDTDPEGEMSFEQPDEHNTFSELFTIFEGEIHAGAIVVGLTSLAFLLLWNRSERLKASVFPAPLAVVIFGVLIHMLFLRIGGPWAIQPSHLVQIPISESASDLRAFLTFPDFSQWLNPAIYVGAVTIAIVASLETLLNLEAVDKLDPENRESPPNRELIAQGAGNMVAGLIGAIPVTSVIIRSSVNVNTGAKTKRSAVLHGVLLVVCIALIPAYLNMIPLSALAAILLVTGFKLASPKLFREMAEQGRYQFIPFLITLVSIVFTDLLIGILIGLGVSVLFILASNLRRPVRRIVETHLHGDIVHIELANQVSFLNRAALHKVLYDTPHNTNLVIDASESFFIDPDILGMIREFRDRVGPSRNIKVSLRGFREKYHLSDETEYADYSTRELQDQASPQQVLDILREGNRRFRTGKRLSRDFGRQVDATAGGQNPLAVVLGCIDSRVPAEIVFDLGIGDVFVARVAGNVIGTKSLASVEYGVSVAGVKLVVVLGHTRCGAVTSAVQILADDQDVEEVTGSQYLGAIIEEIEHSIEPDQRRQFSDLADDAKHAVVDQVGKANVLRTVEEIVRRSPVVKQAVDDGRVLVVGAIYDVKSGEIEFLSEQPVAATS